MLGQYFPKLAIDSYPHRYQCFDHPPFRIIQVHVIGLIRRAIGLPWMFDRISRELRRLAAFKRRVYVYSATSLSARRISRSSAGVTVAGLRKTGGNAPNNERANFLGWFLSVLLSGVTACDYNPDCERDYYRSYSSRCSRKFQCPYSGFGSISPNWIFA
jgi:hypothetical protein